MAMTKRSTRTPKAKAPAKRKATKRTKATTKARRKAGASRPTANPGETLFSVVPDATAPKADGRHAALLALLRAEGPLTRSALRDRGFGTARLVYAERRGAVTRSG